MCPNVSNSLAVHDLQTRARHYTELHVFISTSYARTPHWERSKISISFPDFFFFFVTSLFISSQARLFLLSLIEPMETIIGYNMAQEPNSNTLLPRSYRDRYASAKQRRSQSFHQQPFRFTINLISSASKCFKKLKLKSELL